MRRLRFSTLPPRFAVRARACQIALVPALVLLAWVPARPAAAVWAPEGVDLERPRLLFRGPELPAIQAKLDRDPLPAALAVVLSDMQRHIDEAESIALDDHAIVAERVKSRAARNLAFLYAVDRRWSDGRVEPFPTRSERAAAGERVQSLLIHMFTRSRIAIPPPLGGNDRDISTSEEIISYASAYDALRGAGWDFGAERAAIEDSLAALTSELYHNYAVPSTAADNTELHQNNHRSKSGAAMAMGAIALAEYVPAPGSDPEGIRDPRLWLELGLDLVDTIWRHVLVTGDGAYAEGPFYWRFSCQNLIPFFRAWDGLVGTQPWPARGGVLVPSGWRHPLFARMTRWMLDMTFPSGALVHIDDGNPGRSYYFGAAPLFTPDAPHFVWRWQNAPRPYETDGNIDLGPDAIAHFDPDLAPAPPGGSPTAFYLEGGDAVFRSDWSPDAVMAVVLGEYDTASSMGRDRDGLGRGPQSHEHPEPGSFLLHAYGERLALDPGYFEFGDRLRVNQPSDHNVILVDGKGPIDPLGSTLAWAFDPLARPVADGHARLSHALDTATIDAVRVTMSYGNGPFDPYAEKPLLERRFVFGDDRYLLVGDRIVSRDGRAHEYRWLLHGNAGGASGGDFEQTPLGGRWTRSRARLDVGFAFDAGPRRDATRIDDHEQAGGVESTHVVLETAVTSEEVTALELVYPSRTSASPPEIATLPVAEGAGLLLRQADEDRRVVAWRRAGPSTPFGTLAGTGGLPSTLSDGSLAVFDAHGDGRLRFAYAEDATRLVYDGVTLLASSAPARLALAPDEREADGVAEGAGARVEVGGLAFAPRAADGACALDLTGSVPAVTLGRERRFRLRADAGNSRPAADPGPDQRVPVGARVRLDGRASCDLDGDALTPRWELVSAPPRGAWQLEEADTWQPRLLADAAGPHRVRLTVTDAQGSQSLPQEVTVMAGLPCQDGVDGDLDGMIDSDDPACASAPALVEDPACDNGLDDDGDGRADFGADPECRSAAQLSERRAACGLGFELAPVAAGLLWLSRRRRRALGLALASLLLLTGCPRVDVASDEAGFVEPATWRARQDDYLDFATATDAPESVLNTIAHMERDAVDPAYDVMARRSPIPLDAWDAEFAQNEGLLDTRDFGTLYLLNAWLGYAGHPLVPQALWDRVEQTLADFKFWYLEPTPPGMLDDTIYWTENHQIIFYAIEYLVGQTWPDRVMTNDGRTGAVHRADARRRIMRWLDRKQRFGFNEWLSNIYYQKDLTPLLTLIEYAEDDPELVRHAGIVLDQLLFELALHTYKGTLGTTHGRTEKKDMLPGTEDDTWNGVKLLFDTADRPYTSSGAPDATLLARARRYRVPRILVDVARDPRVFVARQRTGIPFDELAPLESDPLAPFEFDYDDERDLDVWWGMNAQTTWQVVPLTLRVALRDGLFETTQFAPFKDLADLTGGDGDVAAFLAQGLARQISLFLLKEVNIYTRRTPDYLLSTAQSYRHGSHSEQAHPWQATFDPEALIFTSHPAIPVPQTTNWRSDGRPGYWTGNGSLPRSVQHENVGISIYAPQFQRGTISLDFLSYEPYTHAYVPQDHFDEVVQQGPWTFARHAEGEREGYVALYSWQETEWVVYDPAVVATNGMLKPFDLRTTGSEPDNVWIVECGRKADGDGRDDPDEWPSFAAFRAAIAGAALQVIPSGEPRGGFRVEYASPSQGPIRFGWADPLMVRGAQVALDDYPRFDNPWAQVPRLAPGVLISDERGGILHSHLRTTPGAIESGAGTGAVPGVGQRVVFAVDTRP